MDDVARQIFARLTAHEFALEILYSRFLAQLSAPEAEKFAQDIKTLAKQAYMAADAKGSSSDATAIASDAEEMLSRFLKKSLDRADVVRGR